MTNNSGNRLPPTSLTVQPFLTLNITEDFHCNEFSDIKSGTPIESWENIQLAHPFPFVKLEDTGQTSFDSQQQQHHNHHPADSTVTYSAFPTTTSITAISDGGATTSSANSTYTSLPTSALPTTYTPSSGYNQYQSRVKNEPSSSTVSFSSSDAHYLCPLSCEQATPYTSVQSSSNSPHHPVPHASYQAPISPGISVLSSNSPASLTLPINPPPVATSAYTPPSITTDYYYFQLDPQSSTQSDFNIQQPQQAGKLKKPVVKCHPCPHPDCVKSFARVDELRRHQRTHCAFRPFQCDVCHKGFTRSDHLRTHYRTHTGERPYPCSHCDRRFARSDERNRHMRTHLNTSERRHLRRPRGPRKTNITTPNVRTGGLLPQTMPPPPGVGLSALPTMMLV